MASRRSLVPGAALLVALAATGAFVVFVLGDRPAGEDGRDGGVAALQPRVEGPAEDPSLEGRPDARPLKTATLDALLAALRAPEREDARDDPALQEIRERGREDPSMLERLLARLGADDVGPRGAVLRALAALGAPAARPLAAWGLGLGSKNGWRFTALDILRGMGPEAAPAVDLLLAALPGETEAWRRRVLFDTLAAIGPAAREAVPLLTRYLTPPLDDAWVRDAAVTLAAVDGDDPATIEVFRAALLDEETLARPGVLEAVGRLGPAGAPLVPLLIELLEDPEDGTRFQAAAALAALGAKGSGVIDALVSMLEHDHAQGQRAAAAALAALGPAGARALARVGEKVEDIDVRLTVAGVLLTAGGHGDVCADVLLSVLDEECDKGWQQRALNLLARVDPPPAPERVLAPILRALEDPTLAASACRALANVPGEEARTALRDVLGGEGDAGLDTAALDALLRSMAEDPGRDAFVASLLMSGTRPDLAKVVLQRVRRLAPRGQASVLLPAFEPWLAHEDAALRAQAYLDLGGLAGEEDARVERLIAGLADGEVAAACASALRQLPQHAQRSVPAMVEALLALPVDSPHRAGLTWVPIFLARGWPGARAWLESRRETADEAGQRTLDELLARLR